MCQVCVTLHTSSITLNISPGLRGQPGWGSCALCLDVRCRAFRVWSLHCGGFCSAGSTKVCSSQSRCLLASLSNSLPLCSVCPALQLLLDSWTAPSVRCASLGCCSIRCTRPHPQHTAFEYNLLLRLQVQRQGSGARAEISAKIPPPAPAFHCPLCTYVTHSCRMMSTPDGVMRHLSGPWPGSRHDQVAAQNPNPKP